MNANTDTDLRWIDKRDAVCPSCLTVGHLEYQEASWDHRCPRTRTVWAWRDYRAAVKAAARRWAA